jgi:6-phosphogluconolactonase (cycloisomerase 2 family)
VVAIKVFCLDTRGAQKSFIAECNALRNVQHRNLVPILTACSTMDSSGNDFKALVYKFMPRGDLNNLLYSTRDGEDSSCLNYISLDQRLSTLWMYLMLWHIYTIATTESLCIVISNQVTFSWMMTW